MSEKHKLPDNIGTIIKGKLPEIEKYYDLMGNEVYSMVDKAIISMQENINDKLCEHIRQVAMDNGIDTVYVMDKKVITQALTKQLVAKKPICIALSRDRELAEHNIMEGKCPTCGETVTGNWYGEYCGCCGQKLKWED